MIETGDIIFAARKSIIVKFMSLFQSDPVYWGHVMVAKDDKTAWEANWTLQETDIGSELGSKNYKIIRKLDLTEKQKETMRKEAVKLLGLRYGVWRIVLQMLDHIFHTNWFTSKEEHENIQVCSSYVAWVYYKSCGYRFNNCGWASCDPDDIEDDQLDHPETWEVLIEKGIRRKSYGD